MGQLAQVVIVDSSFIQALLALYPGFDTVYGPTLHKKERRRLVFLRQRATDKRTTIAFAKAIVEVRLGRLLTKDEQADHIDNNSLNDAETNLQVLSQSANRAKQNVTEWETIVCPVCGRSVRKKACDLRKNRKARPQAKGPFCSRKCGAFSRRSD